MSGESSAPSGSASTSIVPEPVNKHLPTAVERQRQQLARLLKDPEKPVVIPKPPKDKTLRPAREMMKNVQGSSAGAGSGEFHVYKQNRRREYERLKLMDEKSKKEAEALEFEQRRRERLEAAEAKTAKNRAKRQKKKQNRSGKKDAGSDGEDAGAHRPNDGGPIKKRRLLGGDGKAVVFRRPGEEGSDDEDEDDIREPAGEESNAGATGDAEAEPHAVIEQPTIVIHDE